MKMKTMRDIKRILARHKKELKERYGVKEIAIFGSFVRGEAKEGSDLDILVEFDKVPDLLKFIEVEEYIESLLGIKVDLVRKSVIRKEIKDKVMKNIAVI
ncbi:MAG: nucleotidyltransferase [Candidatus Aenigmatarchaeota archaeon]|nr:MAG: nucleotidyltransferase [Candidatus Aenigmarchaeota archaeon]